MFTAIFKRKYKDFELYEVTSYFELILVIKELKILD
jgi:hypothetical protein